MTLKSKFINYFFRFVMNKREKLSHQPKFINENVNLSTRFNTNESNESFDSNTNNKCKDFFINLLVFTPVHNMDRRLYQYSMQKIDFNQVPLFTPAQPLNSNLMDTNHINLQK